MSKNTTQLPQNQPYSTTDSSLNTPNNTKLSQSAKVMTNWFHKLSFKVKIALCLLFPYIFIPIILWPKLKNNYLKGLTIFLAIIFFFLFFSLGSSNPKTEVTDLKKIQEKQEVKLDKNEQNSQQEKNKESESKEVAKTKDEINQEKEKQVRHLKVVAYSDKIVEISTRVGEDIYFIGNFVSQNDNPLLWTDYQKIEFIGKTVSVEEQYDRAKNIQPPLELRSVHKLFVEGLELYKEAVIKLREGVDEINIDKILDANKILIEGNEKIAEANTEMEKYL